MVSPSCCTSGDDAELPVVKTVEFVSFATTGALVPFAAIFAITPPWSPWWLVRRVLQRRGRRAGQLH